MKESRYTIAAVAGVLCLLCIASAYAVAESEDMAHEDIKQLVVMVDALLADEKQYGAGIIFGVGSDSLYIATANHVVRSGLNQARDIRVRFYWSPDREASAKLLRTRDAHLDLAVLRVDGLAAINFQQEFMPFERVRHNVQVGSSVYLLGYPRHKSWRMNTTPDKVALLEGHTLEFESNFLIRGHSGGALLDQNGNLLGMLRSEDPPYGEALTVNHMIWRLRQWRYPVDLGELPMPRRFSLLETTPMEGRACAVTPNGAAYCWGNLGTCSWDGGVGVGATRGSWVFASQPRRMYGGLRFQSLNLSVNRTCGVTTAGALYCWGNLAGFGVPSDDRGVVPVRVPASVSLQSVALDWRARVALTTTGELYRMSSEDRGALKEGELYPDHDAKGLRFRAIDGTHGITTDGALYENLGYSQLRTVLPGIKFGSLSNGCAISADGVAYCSENNSWKAMWEGRRVKSSGELCRVDTDGSLFCSQRDDGKHTWGTAVQRGRDNRFTTVRGDQLFGCAIAADATVHCFGHLRHTCGANWRNEAKKYGPEPVPAFSAPHLQAIRAVERLRSEGAYEAARQEAARALGEYPKERLVRLTYAELLGDVGLLDQGLAELRALLGGDKDRSTYLASATMNRRARRFHAALDALDAAARLSTTPADRQQVTLRRASTFEEMDRPEKAEAAYRKVLGEDPKSATAMNNLAFLLAKRNTRLPEARQLVEHALKLEPGVPEYLDTLGLIHERMGESAEAERHFVVAWDALRDPDVAERLGDVHLKNRKRSEAVARWQQALEEIQVLPPVDRSADQIARLHLKVQSAGANSP
jgi:tetratricopeptide (TPR) repeat protein